MTEWSILALFIALAGFWAFLSFQDGGGLCTSLCTPPADQSYLQQLAGSLVLLLLDQHTGAHQGHICIVQEILVELAVQHGCD